MTPPKDASRLKTLPRPAQDPLLSLPHPIILQSLSQGPSTMAQDQLLGRAQDTPQSYPPTSTWAGGVRERIEVGIKTRSDNYVRNHNSGSGGNTYTSL